MKKLFFIAAMAGAALVGCTKNEVNPGAQQGEITFAAPVVGLQTKAPQYGEVGVNYNENESFGVYALHTAGDFASWEAGTLYMGTTTEGLKCWKNAGENYWAPGLPYYWPKEGKLTFAAYSPYDLTNVESVSYGKTGLTVTGFELSANTAEHFDFLYAERVCNYEEATMNQPANEETDDEDATYKYDGVNLMFKHAMSSVVFKVARNSNIDASTTITLNSITLTGVTTKATFEENITAEPYTASPKWTASATGNVVTYNLPVSLTTDLTEYVNNGDDDVILIPQVLDGVNLVLNYNITTPGGHTVNQETTVSLKSYTGEWVMGMRYTYNITIDMYEVVFDPAVAPWVDETAQSIVL